MPIFTSGDVLKAMNDNGGWFSSRTRNNPVNSLPMAPVQSVAQPGYMPRNPNSSLPSPNPTVGNLMAALARGGEHIPTDHGMLTRMFANENYANVNEGRVGSNQFLHNLAVQQQQQMAQADPLLKQTQRSYLLDNSVGGPHRFWKDSIKFDDGASVSVDKAYKVYSDYAKAQGTTPFSQQEFEQSSSRYGLNPMHIAGARRYIGISLPDNAKEIGASQIKGGSFKGSLENLE